MVFYFKYHPISSFLNISKTEFHLCFQDFYVCYAIKMRLESQDVYLHNNVSVQFGDVNLAMIKC